MEVEPIYENLKPDEVLLLYKTENGIVYVGNKDGEPFVATAKWPE